MATRKKATKKTTRKAAKKTADRRVTRKTGATTTPTAAAKRAAEKGATTPRLSREYAYLTVTPTRDDKGVVNGSKSEFQGPFSNEKAALDDASIMSEGDTAITLFRAVKRGSVQKTTRFVAQK